MKKITKIIFLLILLVPFFLHAETKRTYTESTNIVNNYISRYSNSNKYFIFPSKYIVNDNATIGEFANYKNGGQLSRNEFWASRVSRYYRYSYIYSSYLATGKEFWVHSQYTIDSNLLYNSGSGYKAATRVTEYVKPEIEVTGNGTFNSPWEFVEGYFVDIIPNSTEYGTVAPKSKFVKSGESFDVSIVPNTGYTFDGTNDCGLKSTEIPNRYTIDNVDRDITCVIPFDYIVYEFNLNSDISYQTEPQPSVIYYRIGKGFYKDRALKTKITKLTTVPTYSNYMFDGYYYNGTLIISKTGDINQEMPTFNYNNTSQYLTAQRGNYLIDYELNKGTHGTSHPTNILSDYFIVNNPTRNLQVELDNTTAKGTIGYSGSSFTTTTLNAPFTFTGWDITGMDESNHTVGGTTMNSTTATGITGGDFGKLRSTPGTVNFEATWTSPVIKLPTITKENHTCKWVSNESPTQSYESGATVPTLSNKLTTVKFTAQCNLTTSLMSGSSTTANSSFLRTTIAKKDIEKITFTNSIAGHTVNGTDCWDVSTTQNGLTLAWATDTDNDGLYELTIGSNGKVFLNNGSYLFYNLTNVVTIEGLENVSSEYATTLYSMFYNCQALTSLDLSSFDTSNVTSMGAMFRYCYNIVTIDITGFTATKLTNDPDYMFESCSNLETIYASDNFSITRTSTYNMFTNDTKLVGGQGTTYVNLRYDYRYAHVDGGTSNPGFFTKK